MTQSHWHGEVRNSWIPKVVIVRKVRIVGGSQLVHWEKEVGLGIGRKLMCSVSSLVIFCMERMMLITRCKLSSVRRYLNTILPHSLIFILFLSMNISYTSYKPFLIDYFYKPYEKPNEPGYVVIKDTNSSHQAEKLSHMYESENADYDDWNFSETSKQKWKFVSDKCLSSNPEKFKNLLMSVNGKLYCELRQMVKEKDIVKPTNKKDVTLGIRLFKKALASKLSSNKSIEEVGEPKNWIPTGWRKRSLVTPLSRIEKNTRSRRFRCISSSSVQGIANTNSELKKYSVYPLASAFDSNNIQNTFRKLKRRSMGDCPIQVNESTKSKMKCTSLI